MWKKVGSDLPVKSIAVDKISVIFSTNCLRHVKIGTMEEVPSKYNLVIILIKEKVFPNLNIKYY